MRTSGGRNKLGSPLDFPMTFEQIAAIMGISVSGVYNLYHSAIDKLAHDPEAIVILTEIVETRYELRRNRQ